MTSTWLPIANTAPQYVDLNGVPYSGSVLKAYLENTTTQTNFATDNTGNTLVGDITLNASGYPEVTGNVIIPHLNVDYKIALYPDQAAADLDSGAIWEIDNLKFNFDQFQVTIKNSDNPRSLEDVLLPLRSVKDFGAIGDGVNDDRLLIQACINQVVSEGGGTIYFPDGAYGISARLRFQSSNLFFEFDADARLIPLNSTGFEMIVSEGSDVTGVLQNLSSDAVKKDNQITTSNTIAGVVVGSWIAIRSNALLGGTNTKNTKVNIYRKVVDISGTTYTLNKSLKYNFNISDVAQAGLATFYENIKFIDLKLNQPNFNNIFSIGVNLKFCSNVSFLNPEVYGTKNRGGASIAGRTAIKIENSQDVSVNNVNCESIGWYGVEVGLACDNINVAIGDFRDVRHATDVNWSGSSNTFGGEPIDVTFDALTAHDCAESGFSTHDVGRDIVYNNCKSYNAGVLTPAYGFYNRNVAARYFNCKSYYATLDGFYADTTSFAVAVDNFDAIENGRDGLRVNNYGRVSNLNSSGNEEAGFSMAGGSIDKVRSTLNGQYGGRVIYYQDATTRGNNEQLRITNIDAPSSASQTVGLRLETASGTNPERNVFLDGLNTLTNYGDFLFSVSTGDNAKIPISNGSIINDFGTATNAISGYVTLLLGSATVTTNRARSLAGTSTRGNLYSKIELRVVNSVNAGNIRISDITDEVEFIITSDNASDASTVYWTLGI